MTGNSDNYNHYLFRYLLLTNFFQYIEAGAVPAMLLQISNSFGMAPAEQVSCCCCCHSHCNFNKPVGTVGSCCLLVFVPLRSLRWSAPPPVRTQVRVVGRVVAEHRYVDLMFY